MRGTQRAIQSLNAGAIGSNIVVALMARVGAKTEAEVIRAMGEYGTPRTLQEMRELGELVMSGPPRTDMYYRWATAIRDTESAWSVTPAGQAALKRAQTTGGRTS